ncbi:MAG TPA: lipase maturation factor family protein [Kofleriaceae bacterium]|nr:lipase maturation factor family protein [Kofleriaceae bacterium]
MRRSPSPPRRPLLIYDAACAFCVRAVARLARRTGRRVDYRPLQSRRIRKRHRIPRGVAERASQLVEPTGRIRSGAGAMLGALRRAPGPHPWLRLFAFPVARTVAEAVYRRIARHRRAASRLERHLLPPPHDPRWLVERAVGVAAFAAFYALRPQLRGLYGQRGLQPVAELLEAARAQLGPARYRLLPTLLWLDDSDRRLDRLARSGELAALALALDVHPRLAAATAWATYLSLVSAGRDFLSYQWDALLLEALPLVFLDAPDLAFRWLAARLHFESGVAKLQSGDPTWRDGEALVVYHETAPLPTGLGWWAHQLPRGYKRALTPITLALECAAPVLAFGPAPARRLSFGLLAALQLGLAATANYGFFNLLSLGLSAAILPPRIPRTRRPLWRRLVRWATAAPLLLVSVTQLLRRLRVLDTPPGRVEALAQRLHPFRIVNHYGLFSVMTVTRPEIVIEGSNDGVSWLAYELPSKPGDPARKPPRVAPLHPRLDWQLWFAAMAAPPRWFQRLVERLLAGEPEVLGLFAHNPFPEAPPRFIRAVHYQYRMTDRGTRKETGAWWHRERLGLYFPAVQLAV